MDGWLGFNSILSMQAVGISCLKKKDSWFVSMVQRPTGHFEDDLPRQSLD